MSEVVPFTLALLKSVITRDSIAHASMQTMRKIKGTKKAQRSFCWTALIWDTTAFHCTALLPALPGLWSESVPEYMLPVPMHPYICTATLYSTNYVWILRGCGAWVIVWKMTLWAFRTITINTVWIFCWLQWFIILHLFSMFFWYDSRRTLFVLPIESANRLDNTRSDLRTTSIYKMKTYFILPLFKYGQRSTKPEASLILLIYIWYSITDYWAGIMVNCQQ